VPAPAWCVPSRRRSKDYPATPASRCRAGPEIADRPVARGVAAEERHLDRMIRHIGVGHALLGEQQVVHVVVVDDHGAFGAEQLDAVGLPERRIARRQRVADAEVDHGAVWKVTIAQVTSWAP